MSIGTSSTMAEISMSCSKIADSGSWYRCDDRVIEVLGVRPLVALGVLLVTPPVAAALTPRTWVAWTAVIAWTALAVVGLVNWSSTSYWSYLLYANPLAVIGAIVVAAQTIRSRLGRV